MNHNAVTPGTAVILPLHTVGVNHPDPASLYENAPSGHGFGYNRQTSTVGNDLFSDETCGHPMPGSCKTVK